MVSDCSPEQRVGDGKSQKAASLKGRPCGNVGILAFAAKRRGGKGSTENSLGRSRSIHAEAVTRSLRH
jgi:hypothetical protein